MKCSNGTCDVDPKRDLEITARRGKLDEARLTADHLGGGRVLLQVCNPTLSGEKEWNAIYLTRGMVKKLRAVLEKEK